jgi:hypothetical protein
MGRAFRGKSATAAGLATALDARSQDKIAISIGNGCAGSAPAQAVARHVAGVALIRQYP